MSTFTRKLRWKVNFHLKAQVGDAWFFKWRALNLPCLTGGKKFTFKLSRSASYLYSIVGQKKILGLPYPSLLDLTNHSISSFFSNMGIASDYSNCHSHWHFSFSDINFNIVQNDMENMFVGVFPPWRMASCKTKFSFKARFTNVDLTRNVDVCYTFLNIKNLNYLLKRNTFACIMIKKKKKPCRQLVRIHAENAI